MFLFLSPFLIASLIELSLPVNYFANRFWESLNVYNRTGRILLPGPFYPDMEMSMTELGDLGAHTPYAEEKHVTWVTNTQGFRTKKDPHQKYDVVLIGDSLAVGSGVDQKNTPAEVLERETGLNVYGMGGYFPVDLINSTFLETSSPRIVVNIQMERYITDATKFETGYHPGMIILLHDVAQKYINALGLSALNPIFVSVDRLLKGTLYRSTYAKINFFLEPKKVIAYGEPKKLFFNGEKSNDDIKDEVLQETVSKIVEVDEYFKKRGIRFVLLVVPNKETLYFNLLPGSKKPHFIKELTDELKKRGVLTLDTQEVFLSAMQKTKKDFYFTDDTHWNEEGILLGIKTIVPLVTK